jgi:hypothetical protein
LSLFEERDGWRYTAFVTNTAVGALQWLEARHRAHARVEDRIRCAKDTGLRRLPSREFTINQAWCVAAAIAADLIAGCNCTPWTVTSPQLNPNGCATACCTPPRAWSTDNAAAGCVSPPLGPGPTRSPPRSPESRRSPHPADQLSP